MPGPERIPGPPPLRQRLVNREGMVVDPVWTAFLQGLSEAQFLPQPADAAGAASGQYLVVVIKGVRYKLALLQDT